MIEILGVGYINFIVSLEFSKLLAKIVKGGGDKREPLQEEQLE